MAACWILGYVLIWIVRVSGTTPVSITTEYVTSDSPLNNDTSTAANNTSITPAVTTASDNNSNDTDKQPSNTESYQMTTPESIQSTSRDVDWTGTRIFNKATVNGNTSILTTTESIYDDYTAIQFGDYEDICYVNHKAELISCDSDQFCCGSGIKDQKCCPKLPSGAIFGIVSSAIVIFVFAVCCIVAGCKWCDICPYRKFQMQKKHNVSSSVYNPGSKQTTDFLAKDEKVACLNDYQDGLVSKEQEYVQVDVDVADEETDNHNKVNDAEKKEQLTTFGVPEVESKF